MNKYLQILRRRFYLIFRKKYVQESLSKRKGTCNQCSCCEVKLFCGKWKCKNYDFKNKLCKAYTTKRRSKTCYTYPFDEKDKFEEFKDRCGFYWDDKSN